MNLNAKVALSLILGASTLLSACDNKENTSTQVEKAVRMPAPTEKAESAVEKSKELVAETKPAEKAAEKTESTEVKADANKADVKSDAVKAEVKKEAKADDVEEKVSEKKETVVAQQATTPLKPRVVATEKALKESAERKQQRAVLNVLEKQYEEVRCSADAKNLSGDSFCRQEERRLFLEIQRIKDELRGIKE